MKLDYTKLYTHFIFNTLTDEMKIPEKNRDRIEKYITGIVRRHQSKLYAIYANPEHVHFLVSRSPDQGEEELATIIADSSEKFINENRLVQGQFQWQQSGAAFSVSKSAVDRICKYILNQPEHHKHESFGKEFDRYIRIHQDD